MPSRAPALRRHLAAAVVASLLAACAGAAGSPSIAVSDARVPAPAGPNAAAYLTLRNSGDGADRLVAVDSDAAGSVELHESTVDGGTMSMRQVEAIEVPAGGEAVLEPGGLHVMLLEVDEGLTEGDTVELVLTFETSPEQTVEATVVPLVEDGADHGEDHATAPPTRR